MKKLVIAIALLVSCVEIKTELFSTKPITNVKKYPKRSDNEPMLTSLKDIFNYHIKSPDNVNQKSLIIAGSSIIIGLIMYYGADKVMTIPVLKDVLSMITSEAATSKDIIHGLSLVVSIFGSLGLYQNYIELRQKFTSSLMSIVLGKYLAEHTINLWSSSLQSVALLHLLSTAGDLVVKTLRKSVRSIEAQEEKDALKNSVQS